MDIETQRQEAKLRKNLEQEKAKLLERKRIDNEARQATAHKAKQKQEDEELKHLADLRSKMAHEAKEVQAKLDARFKSQEQTKKTAAPSRAADVNSKPHVKQAVPAAKVKHGASRKNLPSQKQSRPFSGVSEERNMIPLKELLLYRKIRKVPMLVTRSSHPPVKRRSPKCVAATMVIHPTRGGK
jgi:hypothetical protein